MPERELGNRVRELALQYGVHAVHLVDSRTVIGGAGMPDWILIGRKRLVWRELKGSSAELRGDQRHWKWMLKAAGQDWDLWRPLDLASGTIERTFQDLA